jgi:cathepsin A (carboxypeptidase C)
MNFFDRFAEAAKAQYGVDVLNTDAAQLVRGAIPSCSKLAARCQLHKVAIRRPGAARRTCVAAETACAPLTSAAVVSGRNLYDVRRPCTSHPYCYSFADVTRYLRLPATRAALALPEGEGKAGSWQVCNLKVDTDFAADWPTDWDDALEEVLDAGVRVLNFAGDADYICNWVGSKAYTMALHWSGRGAYHTTKDYVWYHPRTRKSLGEVRSAGGLTNVRVYNAGHMVSQDQPETALLLVQTWLGGKFVVGYDELPFPAQIAN